MCIDVFIDICIDMRMHACIDMGIDMCIHMQIHMHIHMRIHMCVGMCVGMFELAVTSKKRDAILGAILTSNWFLRLHAGVVVCGIVCVWFVADNIVSPSTCV